MTLAKLLFTLLIPLGLLLLLLIGALLTIGRGRAIVARLFLIASIVLVWVMGTPVTAGWLAQQLESGHPPVKVADAPRAEAIVVLGGGIAQGEGLDAPSLGDEANRAWFAARLFHAGKAPLVIVSAGGDPPEGPLVAEVLEAWGVPADRILVDDTSSTTRQNATGTRRLAADKGLDHILLVTTAAHMPRAAAAFRMVGFEVMPFPVGHRAPSAEVRRSWAHWLPNSGALRGTTTMLIEAAGRVYYRSRGWY